MKKLVAIFAISASILGVLHTKAQHALPKPVHDPIQVQEIKLPPGELVPDKLMVESLANERRDWGHDNLKIEDAQKLATGRNILVAILDTGIDVDHPDLKGAILESKDFTNSRSGAADVQGHGTHCAGIVGARKNDKGIIGVSPECTFLNLKCLGDNGSGTDIGIAAAIDYAVERKAKIISGSFGSSQPSARIIDAAIKEKGTGRFVEMRRKDERQRRHGRIEGHTQTRQLCRS